MNTDNRFNVLPGAEDAPGEDEDGVIGASILPFARDSTHGNIYFLLGRERHDGRYPDSNTWGDFSGKTSINSIGNLERPEETASREAWEETAAVVKFQRSDQLPLESCSHIERQLENGLYAMKMTFYSKQNRPQYITYVVEIPFDAAAPDRFHKASQVLRMGVARGPETRINRAVMRNSLQGLLHSETHPALARTTFTCNPVFLEKSALKWIGMPMLEKAASRADGMLINRIDSLQFLRPSFLNRLRALLTEMTRGRSDFSNIPNYHMEPKGPKWFNDSHTL